VAATDGKVVVAQDLSKVYGPGDTEVVALDGVTTAFDRDRFTAIIPARRASRLDVLESLQYE
jgi:ABC-type lipoprotein release transport system permease subunit